MKKSNIIVGLDIGTTKICAIVGAVNDQGGLEVVGVGSAPSHGLRRGVVVNIDETVDSIKTAVQAAEKLAGIKVESVITGVAGGHITSMNSHGVVAISGSSRSGLSHEVNQNDINRLIDSARAVSMSVDRELIHTLVKEYVIDGNGGIKNPLGMSGVRLEAEVHIVTGAVASVQNITKSVQNAGYMVDDIVLQPIASAEAVLTEDEKELGTLLIDIGGGTTDMALFVNGSACYTEVLSIGGNHFTNDIAHYFRAPLAEAEKIKINYGCAIPGMAVQDIEIELSCVGGNKKQIISPQMLSNIIAPRAEEVFDLVGAGIRNEYQNMIAGGIVLTGGAVILEGMPELAEAILKVPVRRGIPINIKGGLVNEVSSPRYATAVGLLKYGLRQENEVHFNRQNDYHSFDGIFQKMKAWFRELF